MRMLSGVEAPDRGTRIEGHQVVMQYFAQDEATRLDPTLTVYQTLAGDSPIHMVPHIRNILGGFLFSGDDVEKPVRVLSGGERTRLAVARMLLRPSNTLLLDEPTNHLDLDSKDVLLDALEDFGGTLIFVSHDRYFVDKLATKVIEIGDGDALLYPGNYEEFLWSKKQRERRRPKRQPPPPRRPEPQRRRQKPEARSRTAGASAASAAPAPADERTGADSQLAAATASLRRHEAARRRGAPREEGGRRRASANRGARGPNRRTRERASRRSKPRCRRPGFYDNHETAQPGHRPPPGADVGGRRPHEPVGSAADRSVITDQICNLTPPTSLPVAQIPKESHPARTRRGIRFAPKRSGHRTRAPGTVHGVMVAVSTQVP